MEILGCLAQIHNWLCITYDLSIKSSLESPSLIPYSDSNQLKQGKSPALCKGTTKCSLTGDTLYNVFQGISAPNSVPLINNSIQKKICPSETPHERSSSHEIIFACS